MENKNILDNMPNKSPDETTLKKDKIHKECMPLENENSPPKNENLTKDKNMFAELFGINVNKYVEKKNGFSYLSWTYAWSEAKKRFPSLTYKIHLFGERQLPYVYDENTGYMVFTEVTINGLTYSMWMPVMDNANKAMKNKPYTYDTKYRKGIVVEAATMFDINKTIMRCLVKNLAMFGLGLYIYSREDLPEEIDLENKANKPPNGSSKGIEPMDKPVKKSKNPGEPSTKVRLVKALQKEIDKFKGKAPKLKENILRQYQVDKIESLSETQTKEAIIAIKKFKERNEG